MDKKIDHRSLYLRVGYALVRDGHLKAVGCKAFCVFLTIRTYANAENIAYPSLSTISRLTGLSISTVRKSIRILESKMWIQTIRSRTLNGKFKRNNYEIYENELIRGTGDDSFYETPVLNLTDGGVPNR